MKQDGTLVKLETHDDAEIPNSNGDGLREGYFMEMPTVGESFILYYKHKMGGLQTSFIKEILDKGDNYVTFKTNNSIYRLQY